ncbi:helix-turn-helix domain-containing protein [Nocardia sp. NPDC003482]
MSEFPQRLKAARIGAGLTRPVLGQLVGRSEGWVKALEVGRLQQPRLPMLIKLAEALGLDDLSTLTGDQSLSRAAYGKLRHPLLDKITAALVSYPHPSARDKPIHIDALEAQVRQTWELWHGTRHQRSTVAPVLAGLLTDARLAARQFENDERRRARIVLAQVYHLVQLYLSFQPVPDLVLMAGDRAMIAAQDADDPYAIAAAAWYVNHVYRDAGEQAEIRVELARDACTLLNLERSEEDRALHGLMQLAMALSFAKIGREGDAWRHWDKALELARSLTREHPWLKFGVPMVESYAISIHCDLVRGGYAVQHANKLNLGSVTSCTRRSFHETEIGRAYHLKGEPLGAVTMLKRAHETSPDTFGFSLYARSLIPELVKHGGANVRPDAEQLAVALDIPV